STHFPGAGNEKSRWQRWFAVGSAAALLAVFLYMIRSLLLGVLAGILLWAMTQGLFNRLAIRLKQRRGLAAGLAVLITVILIIVPLTVLFALMVADATTLAEEAQRWYEPYRVQIEERISVLSRGESLDVFGYKITAVDVIERLESVSGKIGQFTIQLLQKALGGLAKGALLLGVALYTLFFFYLDGPAFIEWLKRLLPLTSEQSDQLVRDFLATSKASIKVVVIIGLVQGALGGLAFWICGIPAPFFWMMLMAVASVIPAIGAQIITIPAGIFLILAGKTWYGIGLLLWSWIVIANADNLLRPYLVKREVNLHELLVFLSALGGIATFGFAGVLLGPVIAALVKSSLTFYREAVAEAPPDLIQESK
ncbi:MAG: AI-2E family transporter, partial [Calditrichota bacterium]